MADCGYLVSPSQDPSKEEMWLETRKRIGRFLPDLFTEIFPDAVRETEDSHKDSTVTSPAEQINEVEKKSVEISISNAARGPTDVGNNESQHLSQEGIL